MHSWAVKNIVNNPGGFEEGPRGGSNTRETLNVDLSFGMSRRYHCDPNSKVAVCDDSGFLSETRFFVTGRVIRRLSLVRSERGEYFKKNALS